MLFQWSEYFGLDAFSVFSGKLLPVLPSLESSSWSPDVAVLCHQVDQGVTESGEVVTGADLLQVQYIWMGQRRGCIPSSVPLSGLDSLGGGLFPQSSRTDVKNEKMISYETKSFRFK